MVGEGRLEIGVSMVEGREMDAGFACSSLPPVADSGTKQHETASPRGDYE